MIYYTLILLYNAITSCINQSMVDYGFRGNMEGKEGEMLESREVGEFTKLLFSCYSIDKI